MALFLTNYDSYMSLYQQKLVKADAAVKVIKTGDWVQYGEFVMQPRELDAALAKRVNELHDVKVRAVTITMVPEIVKADPKREHFRFNDWHFSGFSRALQEQNLCNYIPITYHEAQKIITEFVNIDVAFVLVAPMDRNGYFNLGTSNSITSYVIDKAKTVIVEVNKSVPVCLGGNSEAVHISQVDYIVESQDNTKLLNLPQINITEEDRKISLNVMEELEDGACLIE